MILNPSIFSSVKIFGPAFMRQQLEAALIWATPGQRGFTDTIRHPMNPVSQVYSTGSSAPMASQATQMSGANSMPTPLPLPTSSQRSAAPGYSSKAAQAAVRAQQEAARAQQEARQR